MQLWRQHQLWGAVATRSPVTLAGGSLWGLPGLLCCRIMTATQSLCVEVAKCFMPSLNSIASAQAWLYAGDEGKQVTLCHPPRLLMAPGVVCPACCGTAA